MPGTAQLSVDRAVLECREAAALGIPAVILFGIPETKDALGSEASISDGVVQQAVRAIKDNVPDLLVATDVCLCEYTDHGHCGLIKNGAVDNDSTLELLAQYFTGYTVSWMGVFVGAAWGLFVGFVAGWFLAFTRNLVLTTWIFFVRARAELTTNRDFLDHI